MGASSREGFYRAGLYVGGCLPLAVILLMTLNGEIPWRFALALRDSGGCRPALIAAAGPIRRQALRGARLSGQEEVYSIDVPPPGCGDLQTHKSRENFAGLLAHPAPFHWIDVLATREVALAEGAKGRFLEKRQALIGNYRKRQALLPRSSLTLIAVFIMGTPVALALARAFASDSAED